MTNKLFQTITHTQRMRWQPKIHSVQDNLFNLLHKWLKLKAIHAPESCLKPNHSYFTPHHLWSLLPSLRDVKNFLLHVFQRVGRRHDQLRDEASSPRINSVLIFLTKKLIKHKLVCNHTTEYTKRNINKPGRNSRSYGPRPNAPNILSRKGHKSSWNRCKH